MKLDANSMLFTDDYTGVIYYVRKKGVTTKITAAPETMEIQTENSSANVSQEKLKQGNCFGVATILLMICLRLII